MGPAHSTIKNQTEKRICVITFTYSDLIYLTYNTLYTIEPGATVLVESQPDPTGLKVGIIYECAPNKKEILYQRFVCKTDSVLTISEIDYDEISWFGDNITGYTKGKLREGNMTALTMADEAVRNVPPTIGQRNGKFEKELIKRVAADMMKKEGAESQPSHVISDSLQGSSSSKKEKPSFQQPEVDSRSAAEKWEQELARVRESAEEKEAELAESKRILANRLARAQEEETRAAKIEAERREKEKLEKIRQEELEKLEREQEYDDMLTKKKKGKKGKKQVSDADKGKGGCIVM